MGNISVGELKAMLSDYPDDYDVLMELHHKYQISKESGTTGWIAYINSIKPNNDFREIRLMN